MFGRQQVLAPKVIDLNEVLAGMDWMLQSILGADDHLVPLPAEQVGHVRTDACRRGRGALRDARPDRHGWSNGRVS